MLTEMDGLDARKSTFVIAATNRPDMIDPAMLRPGRLDKLVYVPLPSRDARVEILATATRKMPLHPSVDLRAIVSDPRCTGFSGADLAALAREAAVGALLGYTESTMESTKPAVTAANFERAFGYVLPSVSPKDEKAYLQTAARLRRARACAAGGGSGTAGAAAGGGAGGGGAAAGGGRRREQRGRRRAPGAGAPGGL